MPCRAAVRDSPRLPRCPRRPQAARRPRSFSCVDRSHLVHRACQRAWLLRAPARMGQPGPGRSRGRRRHRGQFPPPYHDPNRLCLA
jgi:hypothetical protein